MADNENIARKPESAPRKIGGNPNLSVQIPKNIDATAVNSAKDIGLSERQKKIKRNREENLKAINAKTSADARKTFNLKPDSTTATGLEKAIFIAGDGIIKAQFAIDGLFYGKFEYEGSNKIKEALDRGIVNVLNDLSEIDLCQILNSAIGIYSDNIGTTSGSKPFNPEEKPTSPAALAKYNIQKKAFDTQKQIDSFYSSYTDTDDTDSKAKGIYGIINTIKDAFKEINDPEAQSALRDPRLTDSFPQINGVNTFLEKAFTKFNTYSDYRQIPSSDIQNLINTIDKIRAYTILIQGLDTPKDALAFADSVFPNANIQEQLQRLQKLIDPSRLMPFLKNVIQSLKKLQSICNVFASFISFGQVIIKIFTLLVKAFKIILKFLQALGIPSTFITLGVSTTVSASYENLFRFLNSILDRLSQINTLLGLCVNLLSSVVIILNDIIIKTNRMLVSLENCSNADPNIIKDLQDSLNGLQKTADYFQAFLKNYESKKSVDSATFGDFTIQIVTEEVVDDAISLRRRYGIALGKNGTLVVQSLPTFASDNQIIINEVKAILASNGFIKSYVGGFSPSELNTISESLSFVFDNDINIGDLENINFDGGLDSGLNENENDGLGLNAFVNKLKGGKKLRERMRKMMKQNSEKLQKDLSNNGANVKVKTPNLQDKPITSTPEIESLKKEREQLKQKMAFTKSEKEKLGYSNKIKQLDIKIDDLENG